MSIEDCLRDPAEWFERNHMEELIAMRGQVARARKANHPKLAMLERMLSLMERFVENYRAEREGEEWKGGT